MAILDLRAGRAGDAAAHLREQLQITTQTGLRRDLFAGLDCCGHLCAATGRPAEAVTVWAAMSALAGPGPLPSRLGSWAAGRSPARGPAAARAGPDAGGRGAWRGDEPGHRHRVRPHARRGGAGAAAAGAAAGPGLAKLSPRERELVTLVAQGRTDAQIAAQLYITVRTVSSHLDRIRDKTGCRRRADLTRLALSAAWSNPCLGPYHRPGLPRPVPFAGLPGRLGRSAVRVIPPRARPDWVIPPQRWPRGKWGRPTPAAGPVRRASLGPRAGKAGQFRIDRTRQCQQY